MRKGSSCEVCGGSGAGGSPRIQGFLGVCAAWRRLAVTVSKLAVIAYAWRPRGRRKRGSAHGAALPRPPTHHRPSLRWQNVSSR